MNSETAVPESIDCITHTAMYDELVPNIVDDNFAHSEAARHALEQTGWERVRFLGVDHYTTMLDGKVWHVYEWTFVKA